HRRGSSTSPIERLPRHRVRLLMRKESGVLIGPRDSRRLVIGKSQVRAIRSDRHLPPHQANFANLIAVEALHIIKTAALEFAHANCVDAVVQAGISVYICD